MEIKKEEIEKYLADGYTVSQETKYVATKLSISDELPIGTYSPDKGIYVGTAKGKKVWVAMNDAPERMNWDEAMEYPKDGYHLPTKEELMLIYVNLDIINKALVDNGGTPLRENYYWSSTEYGGNYSWGLDMGNGTLNHGKKGNTYVRPVVAF